MTKEEYKQLKVGDYITTPEDRDSHWFRLAKPLFDEEKDTGKIAGWEASCSCGDPPDIYTRPFLRQEIMKYMLVISEEEVTLLSL